ncbi:phage holin family protein [Pararhizobium sp. O133]|uniref:phage holin family protein n=1 Tax=Pararhizobium sp. O133 TaxID=3449278 RepID=UPI003F686B0F
MGPLVAMLSSLVVTDVSLKVSRYKRNGAMWLVASLFFLTAYIFMLVAGAIYLSTIYTPLIATLILAGISLAIGLILIIVIYALNARDKRILEDRRRRSQAQTSLALATALTLFRRQPLLAAGLALGVGTALGLMRKPADKDRS